MRIGDPTPTPAVQVIAESDGTRYRLLVQTDPEGGWLVSWPDVGVFGRGYAHDLHESRHGPRLSIYTWWGREPGAIDRRNIELAAGRAARALEAK